MLNAEYQGNEGFLQRDSAILDRNNLNRAYKRVKRNHGAAGIDRMTVEDALPWLKEHREELLRSIRDESYMPSPVRRKEIPKPDGGVRKLGIPTVVGNRTEAAKHLGTAVLRQQLRLPSETECPTGDSEGKGIWGRRVQIRRIGRPVQIFRHAEPRTAHESIAQTDTGYACTALNKEVSEKRSDGEWCDLQNRGGFAAGRAAISSAGKHLPQ